MQLTGKGDSMSQYFKSHQYIHNPWLVAAIILMAGITGILISCHRNSGHGHEKSKEYGKLLARPVNDLMVAASDYILSEKYDSAYLMYSAVGARYDDAMGKDEKLICERAFNNAGYLSHIYYHDYPQAYDHLLKSLAIADETGAASAYPFIYINIGNVMCATGNWDEGMKYQRLAMKAALKANDTASYLKAHANLISEALLENRISDYADIVASLPDFSSFQSIWTYTSKLNGVAEATLNNDPALAIRLLKDLESEDSNDLSFEERFRFFRFLLLAKTEEFGNHNRNAVNYLKQLEKSGILHPELQSYMYDALSSNYRKLGMTDSAAAYKLKYADLSDILRSVKQQTSIYELKNAYDTRSISFRMEMMSRERTVLRRTIMIVGAFSIAVLALLILLVIYHRRTLRTKRELYERNLELLREIDSNRESRIKETPMAGMENTPNPAPDTDDAGDLGPSGSSCFQSDRKEPDDTESTDTALLDAVREEFETSNDIFQPDFSIEKMASGLGVQVKKLSRTINEGFGRNFASTLQTYRIREACRRMTDGGHFSNLTVEAVAESVGFRSRSNFNAVFKKITGLTPAAWQKLAKSNPKSS